MESYLVITPGDLGDPIVDWVEPAKPEQKKQVRGRVLPTFSLIDPKGSKK